MKKCYMARVEIDTGWEYIKENYLCFHNDGQSAKNLITWEIQKRHNVEKIDWLEFFEIIPCGAYRVN